MYLLSLWQDCSVEWPRIKNVGRWNVASFHGEASWSRKQPKTSSFFLRILCNKKCQSTSLHLAGENPFPESRWKSSRENFDLSAFPPILWVVRTKLIWREQSTAWFLACWKVLLASVHLSTWPQIWKRWAGGDISHSWKVHPLGLSGLFCNLFISFRSYIFRNAKKSTLNGLGKSKGSKDTDQAAFSLLGQSSLSNARTTEEW